MRSKTDLYRQKGVNFFFSWCLVLISTSIFAQSPPPRNAA